MNALIRPILVAGVVMPLAICVFGLRFACNSTELRRIMREVHRNDELEQSRGTTFHRLDVREETVRELIAQRCSLSQALARFQRLDDEWPDHLRELSRTHGRKWSDAERNYQYILALAKEFLTHRPEEATGVLCRLEEGYQELRADRNRPSAMPMKRTEPSR